MKDGLVLPEILTKNNIVKILKRIKEKMKLKKGDCFPNVKLFKIQMTVLLKKWFSRFI